MQRLAERVIENKAAGTPPRDAELVELLAPRTEGIEGMCQTGYRGLHYYRVSKPTKFQKAHAFGPTMIVAAQGRKISHFEGLDLHYDPERYMVVTGEGATFVGEVTEATAARPYLAICLELPADVVAKVLLTLSEAAEPSPETAPAFTAPLDPGLRACLLRFLRALDEPLERQVLAPLAIEELVFRLMRTDAAAVIRRAVGRGADTKKIEEAMRFMRDNAKKQLSVATIARKVAMSPSHFAHRFRAVARVSPMRFMKELRMREARAMLVSEQLRVSEVAWSVGYESASHFSRDFKSFFGHTPAEYVKSLR